MTKANLELTGGAGDIRIDSGNRLVTAKGESPFGPPTFSAKVRGRSADVEIGFNEAAKGTVVGARHGRRTYRRPPLRQRAVGCGARDGGVVVGRRPLGRACAATSSVQTGASAVTIRLGDVPSGERESTLVVKAGVSSVRILLPQDAEARVETQNGLVASDIGGRFERRDGSWETPGYSSASKSWDIRTEAGVGSVSVETY